jgi:hypothetical protein
MLVPQLHFYGPAEFWPHHINSNTWLHLVRPEGIRLMKSSNRAFTMEVLVPNRSAAGFCRNTGEPIRSSILFTKTYLDQISELLSSASKRLCRSSGSFVSSRSLVKKPRYGNWTHDCYESDDHHKFQLEQVASGRPQDADKLH